MYMYSRATCSVGSRTLSVSDAELHCRHHETMTFTTTIFWRLLMGATFDLYTMYLVTTIHSSLVSWENEWICQQRALQLSVTSSNNTRLSVKTRSPNAKLVWQALVHGFTLRMNNVIHHKLIVHDNISLFYDKPLRKTSYKLLFRHPINQTLTIQLKLGRVKCNHCYIQRSTSTCDPL